MKTTNKYNLGWFEYGDTTNATVEAQRWLTIDAQLQALFSILGNGIINGWDVSVGDGLSAIISPGSGHINFIAVQSTSNYIIENLTPSTTNYIYAQTTNDSYWTKNVIFGASLTKNDNNGMYIGYVVTSNIKATFVSADSRVTLGFKYIIDNLIAEHRHVGGTSSPSQINLATDVQGIISQDNLPDIDASDIATGTIDANRLPKIDHEEGLSNNGTLTHVQLDSFIETLSISNNKLMGETSTINLLQLILALKHVYPTIDELLVNTITYIPGISSDSMVDWDNTTAIVDTKTFAEGGQHTITGIPSEGLTLHHYVFDTYEKFNAGEKNNTVVDGDIVSLTTTQKTLTLDEFNDMSSWEIITNDLSSVTSSMSSDPSTYVIPPNSGKVTIGDKDIEIALTIKKSFITQDWRDYKYLRFYIKTESLEHGDIYFYINDSQYGSQNSSTLILRNNTQTVNIDTLDNGWQEVTIDITKYNRASINQIAFLISTQNGWDPSKSFNFNIDNIYLTAGNVYLQNGYIRLIFGNDFFINFWKIRWDAILGSDSSIKSRSRFANTELELSSAIWTQYTSISGEEIIHSTEAMYKYIEIEMYFESSLDLLYSPILKRVFIDFYTDSDDKSFVIDTKEDWESGIRYNIDTESSNGDIKVSNVDSLGNVYYASNSSVNGADSNFNQLFNITGTSFPRSTYQVLNGLQSSFGDITGICLGDNGNIWVCDNTNDRIIEVDRFGTFVFGFYGSFLGPPIDIYSTETTTEEEIVISNFTVLHSIYNEKDGVLYIVFNDNVENIYSSASLFNKNKMYIKIGAQRVQLNKSNIEILGVNNEIINKNTTQTATISTNLSPETTSAITNAIEQASTETNIINKFLYNHHVLKITLTDVEKTTMNYMVNQKNPTISILSPYSQQMLGTSSLKVKFLLSNFILGSTVGENSIRVRIDNGIWQTIYNDYVEYSGLQNGTHIIEAQLVDETGTPIETIGAMATVSFIVYIYYIKYSQPYLSITSPKENQTYSSSPVNIEFICENFPIVPSGQHIRYTIDGDALSKAHYSLSPIKIENLSAGMHTVTLFFADIYGNKLDYTYGEATVYFIVGTNLNAIPVLYMESGCLQNQSKTLSTVNSKTDIDVANILFHNIYAPIDIQINNNEIINGKQTITIAKLRTRSWNYKPIKSIDTEYLDGHSVTQIDMDGNVIFSNNEAMFSDSKENSVSHLGSVEKIGQNEVLIADSINKRAIITTTDLDTKVSRIEWEYVSDRYIVDFHIKPNKNIISIYDSSISQDQMLVTQNSTITWKNESSIPIYIYSGTTTIDIFNSDPDLSYYGDIFKSEIINPGESYSYNFNSIGIYNWFTYPNIITGEINVTYQRVIPTDEFYILENDNNESPFSSRLIKVDTWGNILWSYGESRLVKPRDVRVLEDGSVIIST